MRLMRAVFLLVACAAALGCSKFHAEESQGGETHFLQACEASSECGALSCICGVCTQSCESDEACEALDEESRCVSSERVCEGQSAPVPELCGKAAIAEGDGSTSDGGCTDEDCGAAVQPLVMFVLDTSGSMERLPQCACETPDCEECLPDCSAEPVQKNRWAVVLEALTGGFEDFGCTPHARDAPLATYDLGYHVPYYAPTGIQRADGIIDIYAERLRFGSATFDGWDTMRGFPPLVSVADFDVELSNAMEGLWSYPPASPGQIPIRSDGTAIGTFRYPNTTSVYRMDTGIRNADATEGRLLVAHDPQDAALIAADIQADLRKVRPYGGTPIASALDDVLWYLEHDPTAALERANPERERHVVLITDGYPDDDYRSFGCGCSEEEPADCGSADPAAMKCPYPTAEVAARRLLCRNSEICDPVLVDALHVVGVAIDDAEVVERLNGIAEVGNASSAIFTEAAGAPSLRDALDELLGAIAR